MTAPNQSWAWDVIYDPFGNVSYSWSNPEVMNIRFPGQWFQLETGLAYNWHRHYDATLGRYVQPDPLGLTALMSDGPSGYGYVEQNPVAKTDFSGLLSVSVPAQPSSSIDQCAKKKSSTFWCQSVICGAPHGGVYGALCTDCYNKLLNGTPTLLENGELLTPPPAPKPPIESP